MPPITSDFGGLGIFKVLVHQENLLQKSSA